MHFVYFGCHWNKIYVPAYKIRFQTTAQAQILCFKCCNDITFNLSRGKMWSKCEIVYYQMTQWRLISLTLLRAVHLSYPFVKNRLDKHWFNQCNFTTQCSSVRPTDHAARSIDRSLCTIGQLQPLHKHSPIVQHDLPIAAKSTDLSIVLHDRSK